MPYGTRTRLAALVLFVALGVPAASGEPAAGSAWTDPPAHAPGADKATPEAPKPAPPSPMPAAAPKAAKPAPRPVRQASKPAPARKAVAARNERARPVARRATPAPRRVAAAAMPEAARPYGYGPGYGPGYADERLERLRAAEAAGYLVVRRRSVEFPDGRSLRIYRPVEDGEPF